jgi:hypothetical protein
MALLREAESQQADGRGVDGDLSRAIEEIVADATPTQTFLQFMAAAKEQAKGQKSHLRKRM